MLIDPIIHNNERITLIGSLPSAHRLHQFIQELDAKYKVDSSDPDNTFGRVFLDQAIIQNGVENTLYFAGINTYLKDKNEFRKKLPTHQAIPHADTVIGITPDAQVMLLQNAAHLHAKRIPIDISPDDIKVLAAFREAFAKDVRDNRPDYAKMDQARLESTNSFVDKNDNPIPFCDLGPYQKRRIYNNLLEKQNYANGHFEFEEKFQVPDQDGELHPFQVSYHIVGTNPAPYFATTYRYCQSQEDIDHKEPAYAFYKKWHVFHTKTLTIYEFQEMKEDLKLLKEHYNSKE